MAASLGDHAESFDVEIVIGSYEQILFGYNLVNDDGSANLKLSFTDKSHCSSIRSVAVSDQQLLASGGADETIQLLDLRRRQEAGTLMKHTGTITHIEFFGDYMLSSDETGVICIWKIRGRFYECLKTLTGHKGSVNSMAVHPSGKLLLSVGQDKTIRTWNLITAKRAYTTSTPFAIEVIKWLPDGERYVMLYHNKLDVCLASNAAPEKSITLPSRGHSVCYLNNEIVVVGCEGGTAQFINISTSAVVHSLTLEANRVKSVSAKPFQDSNFLLAVVTNNGIIELHLITVKDVTVKSNLIAATKTLLRPICMQLVVTKETPSGDEATVEDVSEDNPAKKNGNTEEHAKESTAKKNVSTKKTPKVKAEIVVADDAKVNSLKVKGEDEYKTVASVEADSETLQPRRSKRAQRKKRSEVDSGDVQKSIPIKKEAKSVQFSDDTQAQATSGKRKLKSSFAMDSIKRFVSSKTKSSDQKDSKKGKRMRPVDSVKIMKQKMAANKKQYAAKHHHLSSDGHKVETIEEDST